MSKLLIIGLDGATWDLIKPWVAQGKLPILKRLKNGGVWGELESTIPPVTGPSWVSFATGMNPGKTGVFDFLIRRKGTYGLKPISSEVFRGKALWDILSNQGIKVGVMNFPMLCPPYEINGFMVSGMGSPEYGNTTFPKHLKTEIDEVADGYEIAINYFEEKYDDEELFLKDANRIIEKRAKVIYYLMKEKNWDAFFIVLSCTDWIQHFMWKHLDKSYPTHDPSRSKKYKLEFLKLWHKIDQIIGSMKELAHEDTHVFVISDHGFGRQYGCFSLNNWLERERYLVRSPRERIRTILEKFIKPFLHIDFLKVKWKRLTKKIVPEQIDFEKSIAYTLGHTIPFGAIYLNVKDRDPKGFINKEKEYNKVKKIIAEKLENLGHQIGKNLNVKIFDPKEIYKGDQLELAPDILFTINNWECVVIENFNNFLYRDQPYSNRHTGSHRINGIFLAFGPGIKKRVEIKDAKIYDIAPTILHIFNLPLPKDMDGRVLTEIFEEESEFTKRKVEYVEPIEPEKERIRERIKKLRKTAKI